MKSRNNTAPRPTTAPIFVRATAHATGGIATLILDGTDIRALLANVFRSASDLQAAESSALLYGRIIGENGRVVDEAIVAPIGQTESSTGNEQIELSCHGGLGAIAAVEAALQHAGFSHGFDTELLERSHLNGKLSLLALEAHFALARANTRRQSLFLLAHSAFQERLERLGMEAGLGMRREDTGWRARARKSLDSEIEHSAYTSRVLNTHRVSLIGPVNAGKSSLANSLSGEKRHLVSEIPGTTLDHLDTPIELHGLNVLLSDTAGARETTDALELEGQRRAREVSRSADLILLIVDGSRAPSEVEMSWLAEQARSPKPYLLVLTKSDLGVHEAARGLGFLVNAEPLSISIHTGEGLDALAQAIETKLLPGPGTLGAFTERQIALLCDMRERLDTETESTRVLDPLRKLIGSRPNPDELQKILEARA